MIAHRTWRFGLWAVGWVLAFGIAMGCSGRQSKRYLAQALLEQMRAGQRGGQAKEEVRQQLQMAKNWVLNGKVDEALEIYERIVREYPDTTFQEEAAARLKELKQSGSSSDQPKGTGGPQ